VRVCSWQQRWVDIAFADIDIDISDPKYRRISFKAALFGLLTYFIITRKVVSDINVILDVKKELRFRHDLTANGTSKTAIEKLQKGYYPPAQCC